MATGSDTWKGLGVPLFGDFELRHRTAATDHVTLTAASGASGDFLVCRTAGGGELFVVQPEGQLTVASAATFAKLVTVSSGGITLTDGTLTLTKGSTILSNGGLTITGGDITHTSGTYTFTKGSIILTAGGLTVSAGNIDHTSGDVVVTKGDVLLHAGDLIVNKERFIKFSAPIATAPAAAVKGEMFVIIVSETPQIGIAWASNSIKYCTADTATAGRATA